MLSFLRDEDKHKTVNKGCAAIRRGKLMDKTFGIALVLVMVWGVLPCSDYISRSQVLAQSAEGYCPGDDRAGGSHEDQNLDWVGAPHL